MKFISIARVIIKNVLRHLNLRKKVTVNSHTIVIPVQGGVGASNVFIKKHETWLNAVIGHYYKGNGAFIDVGVNLGQTLIKFKTLFPEGKYVGFEPNPNCVAYVASLIKENYWTGVRLVCSGLSFENTVSPMFFDIEDSTSTQSSATFVEGYRLSTKRKVGLYMPTINLDQFFAQVYDTNIELVKIDVEGGELMVLEGMRHLLKREKPLVVVEILPASRENASLRNDLNRKINNFIRDIDFDLYEIIEGDNQFELNHIQEVPSDKADLVNYNYLLVPHETKAVNRNMVN